MKKILVYILLFFVLAGCSKCVLLRSEYYDITGRVMAPKAPDESIDIYAEGQDVGRAYMEIGAVKVMAQHGMSRAALNKELKKRARAAGADAIVDVSYVEDDSNNVLFCGKLLSTKRNMTAAGKAVVFTQAVDQEDKK